MLPTCMRGGSCSIASTSGARSTSVDVNTLELDTPRHRRASPPDHAAPPPGHAPSAAGASVPSPQTARASTPLRCNVKGADGLPIPTTNNSQYTLRATDVGHTIRVQETASNAGGPGTPSRDRLGPRRSPPADPILSVRGSAARRSEATPSACRSRLRAQRVFPVRWQRGAAGASRWRASRTARRASATGICGRGATGLPSAAPPAPPAEGFRAR